MMTMISVGLIHILVHLKLEEKPRIPEPLKKESLVVRDDYRCDNWMDFAAYGARSAEIYEVCRRLEKKTRLRVKARILAVSPSEGGATSLTLAPPQPSSHLQPPQQLPPLPAGVALLELTVQLPQSLLSQEECHVRKCLLGERKAAKLLLGAIVPLEPCCRRAGAEAVWSSKAAGAPPMLGVSRRGAPIDTFAEHWALVRQAVEDLLEQQQQRERYSLNSCLRELPSMSRRCGNKYACDANGRACDGLCSHAESRCLQRVPPPASAFAAASRGAADANSQGSPGGGSGREAGILGLHSPPFRTEPPGPNTAVAMEVDAGSNTDMANGTGPRTAEKAGIGAEAGILDLPVEVLEGIMSRLDSKGLARLRATCTALAEAGAAGGAVPGMRLTLLPHQRAAISWMIRRETAGGTGPNRGSPCSCGGACSPSKSVPSQQQQQQNHHPSHHPQQHRRHGLGLCEHPMFLELVDSVGNPLLWADVGSGELHTSPPPQPPAVRGGFFCDEPGLGKTITALSLILKTLGQLPAPPQGAVVEWLPNRQPCRVGFYTACGSDGSGFGASFKAELAAPLPSTAGAAVAEPRSPVAAEQQTPSARGCSSGSGGGNTASVSGTLRRRTRSASAANAAAAGAARDEQPQPALKHARTSASADVVALRLKDDGSVRVTETGGEGHPGSLFTGTYTRSRRQPQHVSSLPQLQQQQLKRPRAGVRPARRAPRGKGVAAAAAAGGAGRGGTVRHSSGGRKLRSRAVADWKSPSESGEEDEEGRDCSSSGEGEEEVEDRRVAGARRRHRQAKERRAAAEGASGNDDEESQNDVEDSSSGKTDSDDDDCRPGVRRRRSSGGDGGCGQGKDGSGGRRAAKRLRRASGAGGGRRDSGGGRGDGKQVATGGGRTAEEKEGEGGGSGSDKGDAMWVQCEGCQAWRRLPEGTPAPPDDGPWFCHMHPLPEAASCTAPAEKYDEDAEFENAPGYIRPGEGEGKGFEDGSSGSAGVNIDYFIKTLRAVACRLGVDARELANLKALRWLTQQDPVSLRAGGSGAAVPRDVRDCSPEYNVVFRALELQTLADGAGGAKRRRRRGGAGASGADGAMSVAALHTWRAAPYMAKLLLDVESLSAALAMLRSRTGSAALSRFFLSAATLVVLPATIIDHWLLQIRKHVACGTLRVCVLDRIDPRAVPTASSLAWDYDLVVTTFGCLSHGATATTKTVAAGWDAGRGYGGKRGEGGGACGTWLKALRQVHWLRIILDEGHMLGTSTAITNKLRAACGLRAERRWVMTGTPTPATRGSSAAHLQPLLAFLHHEPYGTNAVSWQVAVQRPLEACRPEGRHRLMRLLREIMIRASKADLLLLPRLARKVTVLEFEPQHANSYNELVEVVRRNLLTSDWCDEAHGESLLSSRNAKWSRQMMNNVWLSCCVAGSTNSVVKESDLLETLQLLAKRLGLPPPGADLLPVLFPELAGDGELEAAAMAMALAGAGPPWLPSGHPLKRVEEALRHGTTCEVCGERVRQPMVTPCGHLACLDCTASDRERCPLPSCRTPYAMQAVDDPLRLKHNRQPKWPVPRELIEWQPVYHQEGAVGVDGGHWSADWQLTQSSKISHMLNRLREVGAAPPLRSDNHHYHHEQQQQQQHLKHQHKAAEPASGEPVIDGSNDGELAAAASLPPPLRFVVQTKAIVFTQYGVHMQLVESSLMKEDIPFTLLTQVIGKEDRELALSRFQHDPYCGVLVMDQLGAVGLDLSYASYVMLMEPLPDSSLEQQVISRAHRMGAQKPVVVETLVMRGSAEEALLQLDKKSLLAPALSPSSTSTPPSLATVAAVANAGGGSGSAAGGRAAARQSGAESTADDPRVAEELEGGVQVDRRALRNQLFLLMEKVRLGAAAAGGGGNGGRGGAGASSSSRFGGMGNCAGGVSVPGGAGPSMPAGSAASRSEGGLRSRVTAAAAATTLTPGATTGAQAPAAIIAASTTSTMASAAAASASAAGLVEALMADPVALPATAAAHDDADPVAAAAAAGAAAASLVDCAATARTLAATNQGCAAAAAAAAATDADGSTKAAVAAAAVLPGAAAAVQVQEAKEQPPEEPKRRRVRFADDGD